MDNIVRLYSTNFNELNNFLNEFFTCKIKTDTSLNWEKHYPNPIEIADIVAAFIDNKDLYSNVNMWVSIDNGVFINIKEDNYNLFIQYLFERYPY